MTYLLYRTLTSLAAPLAPVLLRRRARRGKEDPARLRERLGHAGRPRPEGTLVWVHAVSVGEALSTLALIVRLTRLDPRLRVLVTTGTVTSARLMAERLPDRAFHQFAPLDTPAAVRRFLDHWQPTMALWVESEIWPNLIEGIGRRRIPAVLVNARMSERSHLRWRRQRRLAGRLLSRFRAILPWDAEHGRRFAALGAAAIGPAGNLKFASAPPATDPAALVALLGAIEGRPVVLAASTHDGEEAIVAEVHRRTALRVPRLLTILAPRHPARADSVESLLADRGLSVVRRTSGRLPGPETDIYLADTLGEMGTLLSAAPVVFVGGSLVPHGGHNPIEPAQLCSAILFGPHMDTFRDIARELESAGGAMRVADADALAEAVADLLVNRDRRRDMAEAALGVARRNAGVLEQVMAEILPILEEARGYRTGESPPRAA